MGLDKLLVMVDSGEEYQVLDLYKYVYKCGYVECSMLFFFVHDASKAEFVRWTEVSPRNYRDYKFESIVINE